MTLNLYDGARVLLRNGEELVIRSRSTPGHYPWKADGGAHHLCWTPYGRYTIARGDHVLDIIGVYTRGGDLVAFGNIEDAKTAVTKGDPDLFDVQPYNADFHPKGDEKYRLRDGREINGLLFHQDEINTSQRDTVWTRIDGKCRVLPAKELRNHFNAATLDRRLRDTDIVEILKPKAPAELANTEGDPAKLAEKRDLTFDYPYSGVIFHAKERIDAGMAVTVDECGMIERARPPVPETRLVMMDETGKLHPEIPQEPLDPDLPSADERTDAAIERVAGNLDFMANCEKIGADPDLVHEIMKNEALSADEWNDTKGKFQMVGDWKERMVPKKPLLKTLITIAESLGGEFGGWKWGDDPSTIEFSALFSNTLREGGAVGYERWITLALHDDLNNAMLPMKKRD